MNKLITFIEQRNGLIPAVFVILTTLFGIIYSLYLGDTLRFLPDESDYISIASNLARKGKYSLDGETATAFRAPGYPFVLAGLRVFNANTVLLRIVNYIFLGISIYVVYLILRERSSPVAAVLGGGLVIAYPVLFYTAGTLYPQTLGSLLFLVALYFLTKKQRRRIDYILGGLALGYLTLTVPTFAVTVVVIVIWLWVDSNYKITFDNLLVAIIPFLMFGLWTARNYVALGSFVLMSTNSGENLLVGNSENSVPNGGRTIDISQYEQAAEGLDEVARDRYFLDSALEYIQNHKMRVAKLYVLKVLNYFNFSNTLVTAGEGTTFRDLVMLITYGSLLLLFILRLGLILKYPPTSFEILIITLYLINALVSAIFFTRIRFRLPYDYLLIINAALLVDRFIQSRMTNYKQATISTHVTDLGAGRYNASDYVPTKFQHRGETICLEQLLDGCS